MRAFFIIVALAMIGAACKAVMAGRIGEFLIVLVVAILILAKAARRPLEAFTRTLDQKNLHRPTPPDES